LKKVIGFIGLLWLLSVEVISQQTGNENLRQNGFYRSDIIEVQNIYPNPASTTAILKYSLKDPLKEAKIVLHDLLGTITKDYPLNTYETTLKIDIKDLKEGVYFYTLNTDGKNRVTKKLIIKK
jgi:hypothetical protein